ncbi:hypothetical protein BDZ97DRAFT_1385761 [Flammula alnicola]|nr:hypothetical protein BDZ97DRAFT_1385761 [Flammula alnicola]
MTASFQSLPREIVDLFIDQLHENDDEASWKALRACLLVCRAFCHRSRYHLFRQINLSGKTSSKMSPRLHSLLEIIKPASDGEVGGIGPYIKAFEIIIDSTADTASVDYATLLHDSDGVLGNVIEALSSPNCGVRKFSLAMSSSPPVKIGFVNWADLSLAFQESIFDIIKSPSLTFLHLGNIYGMPSNFLRDTNLEHLHLSHTGFSSLTDSGEPQLTPSVIGCVTMNPADCLDGIAGGYLSHLARLSTFTSTIFSVEHMDMTWEAMMASSSSIEALQLDFFGFHHHLKPSILAE